MIEAEKLHPQYGGYTVGKMMEDKEVGELWTDIWQDEDPVGPHGGCRDGVIKLIRKLVEERGKVRAIAEHRGVGVKYALNDFGIDPASWSKDA